MMTYIIRRCLYALPILIGVNIIVFALFFLVNTPDDMARANIGNKHIDADQIDSWKRERSLHLPMFHNDGWVQSASVSAPPNAAKAAEATITLQPGAHRLVPNGDPNITYKVELRDPPTKKTKTEDKDQIKAKKDEGKESKDKKPKKTKSPSRATFEFAGDDEPVEVQITPGTNAQSVISLQARNSNTDDVANVRLVVESYQELGATQAFTETIFYKRSIGMLLFNFGKNDRGETIGDEINIRLLPTLIITLPALLLGTLIYIVVAMVLATFRGTYVDRWGGLICVLMMSISMMFYIIGGQWFFGSVLRLVPIAGFDADTYALRFCILPVMIIIMTDFGATSRFYRTVFLEELHRDHIRTARAKGTPETAVLFIHTLKNAMIPILTGLAVQIPRLLLGSLLIEKFFSIPGMGAYMVEAIQAQDFATVQAVVFLGSFIYVLGLLLTDLSYTLVDPRVRLES
jgi:peptide/nickel transport system permease protein